MLAYPPGYKDVLEDFVLIPKGFVAGTPELQNTMGYLLGRYEVTVREWLAYLGGVNGPLPWQPEKLKGRIPSIAHNRPLFHFREGVPALRFGDLNWPVFGVTHRQIEDYLQWRNETLPEKLKTMGVQFRLPTGEEWNAAARGADARLYPWGDYPNPKFCKILDARKYQSYQEPIARENPAFLCDESPFGVNDMAGSLSEYTSTFKYSGVNKLYAVKGSGWSDSRLFPLSEVRYCSPIAPGISRGFRLCIGADPLYGVKHK
jgi:formylglycine-generating enzyme required for sulfatase activity